MILLKLGVLDLQVQTAIRFVKHHKYRSNISTASSSSFIFCYWKLCTKFWNMRACTIKPHNRTTHKGHITSLLEYGHITQLYLTIGINCNFSKKTIFRAHKIFKNIYIYREREREREKEKEKLHRRLNWSLT